ncbi:MAG: tRNA epoxyqueuosine(34) reductase QueG [Candidatus Altimarinota bacterium]
MHATFPAATLTQQIKNFALQEMGVDFIGITPAVADPAAKKRLDDFLRADFHGEMKYLENSDLRSDPKKLLPEARSIIVIAVNYYREKPETPVDHGRIARYAHGRDYHKVFKKLLKNLADHITQITPSNPPAITRACVDSAPLLERSFAQKAGIGFPGRNGLIITENRGSFVLLGELLTSLELEYDQPSQGTCGTCTRCIDACPTNALLGDGSMDARKCISYLTIESKQPIPEDLAPKMDNLIYGCDICQEVCPYNKQFARPLTLEAFQKVTIAGDSIPLAEILSLSSDDTFLARFAGSPVMRAKRSGLIRNTLNAAINGQQTQLLSQIEKLQQDPHENIRQLAAQAINKLSNRPNPN